MAVLATETFTGANGAAWPAQWTTGLTSGATGGSVDQQSGQGRLVTPSGVGYASAAAHLSGMAATFDCEVDFDFTFPTVGVEQYLIVQLRADAAITEGGTFSANCYAIMITSTDVSFTGQFVGWRNTYSGGVSYAFAANTKYHAWCSIIGAVLQVRIATSGSARPASPTATFTDPQTYENSGRVRISMGNGGDAAARTVLLDNITVSGTVPTASNTDTLFPTSAAATTGTWTALVNAMGSGEGSVATFTSATNGAIGTATFSGYNAQTAIGTQPGTISSVWVHLYANVGTVARWSSVRAQLYSGTTAIGTPVQAEINNTAGWRQRLNFTGANIPTWAQLADLRVVVSATKSGTTSDVFSVDVVGVVVNYVATVPATVGFNDEFVTTSLDPRWTFYNPAQDEQTSLTGTALRFTHGSVYTDINQDNQLGARLLQYITGDFDVSFAAHRGVATEFESLGLYVDNGAPLDSLAGYFWFSDSNSHRGIQVRSSALSTEPIGSSTVTGPGFGRYQRMTLVGTTLTYYSSADGINWTSEYSGTWSGGQAQRVGFITMSNFASNWDLDYFRVVGGAASPTNYKPGQFMPFLED